jgi:hypothetical protein
MEERNKEILSWITPIFVILVFILLFTISLLYQISLNFIKEFLIVISISLLATSFAGFSINEDSRVSNARFHLFLNGFISLISIIFGMIYIAYPKNGAFFGNGAIICFVISITYLGGILIYSAYKSIKKKEKNQK